MPVEDLKLESAAPRKRILLGQLVSNGDCLYATAVARQIKVDYPGCHLTWAISSGCRSMIEGNPDVDEVWEIKEASPTDIKLWRKFKAQALQRWRKRDFDEIFLTQISPGNFQNWVGSVRSSIFRAYPHPITVPVAPVLRLSPAEVEKVRLFAQTNRLEEKSEVILFECSPRSGQSTMTPEKAVAIAEKLLERNSSICFVLSSNTPIDSPHENIVDGSQLSLRENAELTKYCSLLVGSSSGITWIATSDWAKPLPMLQLLSTNLIQSNSVIADHEECGLDASKIVEIYRYTDEDVCACISAIFSEGFEAAKKQFGQTTTHTFANYKAIQHLFLREGQYRNANLLMRRNLEEYGFHFEIVLIPVVFFLLNCFPLPFKVIFWLKRMLSNAALVAKR